MSEYKRPSRKVLSEVIATRVKPVERLAIEQAAMLANATISETARAAILRGLPKLQAAE